MKLHVLGSSSSGNCYLFQSEKTGEVLAVEAGVKFNKVKKVLDFNQTALLVVSSAMSMATMPNVWAIL